MPTELEHFGGNFFEPIVLEDILPGSRAYSEELFGPVFSLYRVNSDEEAIELANSSEYGLSAAVFCGDIERAEAVARNIEAGTIYVNDFVKTVSDKPQGGYKNSGYGKECYKDGLLDMSIKKCLVI